MSVTTTIWFNNVLLVLLEEGLKLQAMILMSVSMSVREMNQPKVLGYSFSPMTISC